MVLNRDHVRSEDDRSEEDILIRSNNFIHSHLLVNVSYWELFFKTLFRVITFLKSGEDVTVVAVLVCISDTWWTFLWMFSSVLVRHVVFTLVDVRWTDLIIVFMWICSFRLQLVVVVSRLWRLWSVSVRLHREQVMVNICWCGEKGAAVWYLCSGSSRSSRRCFLFPVGRPRVEQLLRQDGNVNVPSDWNTKL